MDIKGPSVTEMTDYPLAYSSLSTADLEILKNNSSTILDQELKVQEEALIKIEDSILKARCSNYKNLICYFKETDTQ